MTRIGLVLAVFGLIYILKPGIYQRWFWKKTDVMQQKLTPEKYLRFMKLTGVVFVIFGVVLMILGKFKI